MRCAMNLRRWVAALAVAVLVFAEFSNRAGVHAFDLPQHERVTRAVLEPYRATINGRERAFTEDAIKELEGSTYVMAEEALLFSVLTRAAGSPMVKIR
jgi:hypothetical protein